MYWLLTVTEKFAFSLMEGASLRISNRSRIVGMKEAGLPNKRIARELGISVNTVKRWWQRWQESGDLHDNP